MIYRFLACDSRFPSFYIFEEGQRKLKAKTLLDLAYFTLKSEEDFRIDKIARKKRVSDIYNKVPLSKKELSQFLFCCKLLQRHNL